MERLDALTGYGNLTEQIAVRNLGQLYVFEKVRTVLHDILVIVVRNDVNRIVSVHHRIVAVPGWSALPDPERHEGIVSGISGQNRSRILKTEVLRCGRILHFFKGVQMGKHD